MKYQRKFSQFDIKVPKNFDKVETYFKKYIQTGLLLKVEYKDKESNKVLKKLVQIKEIMMFNQNVYIKAVNINEPEKDFLIPLENSIFYDTERGKIKHTDL